MRPLAALPVPGQEIRVEVLTERIRSLLGGDARPAGEAAFRVATVAEAEEDELTLETQGLEAAEGTSLILHFHDDEGLYLVLGKVKGQDERGRLHVAVRGRAEHQRRRHARRKAALPVRYRVRREGELAVDVFPWEEGETVDVSEGGVMLRAAAGILPGDNLDLEIGLLDRHVRASGRVTRVREIEEGRVLAGVHFLDIAPSDREAIGWFVLG